MRSGVITESSREDSSGTSAWTRRTVCALTTCALLSAAAAAAAQQNSQTQRLQEVQGTQSLQRSDAASRAALRAQSDERSSTPAADPARYGFSVDDDDHGGAGGARSRRGSLPRDGLQARLTASEAQSNRPLKLDAWARDSTGLGLIGSTGAYVGQFHVALTLGSDPNDRSVLASPVNVAVAARGATIDPQPVAISELGRWHDVSITVPAVDSDTYEISVSADPANSRDPVPLSVMRAQAQLWSTPPSIVGWGIGEGTILIEARGMREPQGLSVALRTTNGSLSASRATLNTPGQAEFTLRSTRHPQAIIEIMSTPFQGAGPLVVPFTAPWWFFGAAVAGGLSGAFLRGRGRDHWLLALAIGVVTALVMCLAYAVGINWPERVLAAGGMPKAAEAAVFVLGAVGALVGVSALVPNSAQG